MTRLPKTLAAAALTVAMPAAALANSADTDMLTPLHMAAIKAAYAEPATAEPEVDRLSAIELFRLVEAVRVHDLGQPPQTQGATKVTPENS